MMAANQSDTSTNAKAETVHVLEGERRTFSFGTITVTPLNGGGMLVVDIDMNGREVSSVSKGSETSLLIKTKAVK